MQILLWDSIVRSIVQVLSCSTLALLWNRNLLYVLLHGLYRVLHCVARVSLIWLCVSLCEFYHVDFIVWIPPCGFYHTLHLCKLLCGFDRANSSCKFYCKILSCKLYCIDYIIGFYQFYCASHRNSIKRLIVRILICNCAVDCSIADSNI